MSAGFGVEVPEAMKQDKVPAAAAPVVRSESKAGSNSHPANAASRLKTTPKGKEAPKLDSVNPPGRAKSVPPDIKNNSKVKRSLLLSRPKSGEIATGSQKCKEPEENKVPGPGRSAGRAVVEQFARLRRVRAGSGGSDERRKCEELQEKVEVSESVIRGLQCEVLALKEELERAQSLNEELQLRNTELIEGLALAEAKIKALASPEHVRMFNFLLFVYLFCQIFKFRSYLKFVSVYL